MNTSEAEKDWLRRICGGQPATEQKTAPAKEAERKPVAEKKAKGKTLNMQDFLRGEVKETH